MGFEIYITESDVLEDFKKVMKNIPTNLFNGTIKFQREAENLSIIGVDIDRITMFQITLQNVDYVADENLSIDSDVLKNIQKFLDLTDEYFKLTREDDQSKIELETKGLKRVISPPSAELFSLKVPDIKATIRIPIDLELLHRITNAMRGPYVDTIEFNVDQNVTTLTITVTDKQTNDALIATLPIPPSEWQPIETDDFVPDSSRNDIQLKDGNLTTRIKTEILREALKIFRGIETTTYIDLKDEYPVSIRTVGRSVIIAPIVEV